MWPFKKKEPVEDYREVVKRYPLASCGQQYDHYYWTKIEGWACPHCQRIEKETVENRKQNQLAELIAEKVIAKLKEQP